MSEELKRARLEMASMHKELSTLKAAAKLAAQKKEKPAPPPKNKLVLSGDPNTPLSEQVRSAHAFLHTHVASPRTPSHLMLPNCCVPDRRCVESECHESDGPLPIMGSGW